ncbi:cation:proton antiporter [Embleya sp. AB8]|uniref:cation:proton antiporter n=1 Tax=Embleya sp. AB8 TaxID=3156304 RepID=UPI003C74160E
MGAANSVIRPAHLLAVLGVVVLIVLAGRFAARRARQPEVVGELTAGILAGPLAVRLLGRDTFDDVLPGEVLHDLKLLAEAGLVLFLVGLTHKLRTGSPAPARRATGWVVAGALLPALAAGGLLAGWVLLDGDPVVRGTAPVAALVLMLAVSLSVTAVPVLARILTDRGMTDTGVGRLALTSAIVIDAVSWLLLTVTVGLAKGSVEGFLRSMAVLGCGAAAAVLLRLVLRARAASRLCARAPWGAAVLVGAVAVAMAITMERQGMTAIIGAALAGLAVPATPGWDPVVHAVTRVGRSLVPVFFVVTGVTVLTKDLGSAPLVLIALATFLGIAGKAVGGYLGARLGAQSHWDALRIGALMNTRGLTELIVLQVGHRAGILTTPLFLALVVMALVTTALTGPSLLGVDRAELRRRGAGQSSPVGARALPEAARPER